MSGYIPKEHLNAYRQWQVESFDPPAPEPEEVPPTEADAGDGNSELVANLGLPTAEEIEHIHNEAYQSGYQAGYEEGQREGKEEGYREGLQTAEAEARRVAALADNVEAALAAIDQAVANEVLALALETAHQVLRSTISAKPETLLPTIREALAALPLHHGHIALHINPADAEMVRQHLGDQFMHSGWRMVEDKEIEAGGCFIRAGSSEVDATLSTRWKRVLGAIGANPEDWLEQQ